MTPQPSPDDIDEQLEIIDAYILARRSTFARQITPDVLRYISERFECGCCAYQARPDGTFDPLDAMRRDAYREVLLWLTDETEKGRRQPDAD